MLEIITESEYKNIQHLLPLKLNKKYYINTIDTINNGDYTGYLHNNINYLIIKKLDINSCYFDQFDKNNNCLTEYTYFVFRAGGFEFWLKPKERLVTPKTRFSILI